MVANIRQILPFSCVDGPGNRSVVFFQGCNMRCKTCHNPETIPHYRGATEGIMSLSPEEVMSRLLPYRPFVRGVTLTGGECTLQVSFLKDLIPLLRDHDYEIFVDTNGSDPLAIAALVPLVDGFLLDIKSADPDEHFDLTAWSLAPVLESFDLLLETTKLIEIRTVVHPKLESAKTLTWVCDKIVKSGNDALYKVIAFRPHGVKGSWQQEQMPDGAFMASMGKILRSAGVSHYELIGV